MHTISWVVLATAWLASGVWGFVFFARWLCKRFPPVTSGVWDELKGSLLHWKFYVLILGGPVTLHILISFIIENTEEVPCD